MRGKAAQWFFLGFYLLFILPLVYSSFAIVLRYIALIFFNEMSLQGTFTIHFIALTIALLLPRSFLKYCQRNWAKKGISILFAILIFLCVTISIKAVGSRKKQEALNNITFNSPTKALQMLQDKVFKLIDIFYDRPSKEPFKIDNTLYMLFPHMARLLETLGVNRADIVLWQGVGSCGQATIVFVDLARQIGIEARAARLIGQDHEFPEVYINGTWYVYDFLYTKAIMTPIQDFAKYLKEHRPDVNAKGVLIDLGGGRFIDASKEHGFKAEQ